MKSSMAIAGPVAGYKAWPNAAAIALALVLGCSHSAAEPSPPAPSTPAAPERVLVEDIQVTGNSLLAADVLQSTLAPFKGLRTFAELKQAAAAVQSLYRQAGYGAVLAYIPEQPFKDGRVVLAVLEGRLRQVTVLGHERTAVDAVRKSLPALVEGQTPQLKQIDVQVRLANENPARKLALTLEAGPGQGEVDASVQVREEPGYRCQLGLDNSGSAQTGRLRLGLGCTAADLFDADHQLSWQAQTAPEKPSAVRIFTLSYRLPVYQAGLMLGAYASHSNVDAGSIATAAGALSFNGRGRVWGVNVMRPFYRLGEFEQGLTASLERRDYLNSCRIADLPEGACGPAGESVSVYPLNLEYLLQRGGERPLWLSITASYNLGGPGANAGADKLEAVRPGARRHYGVLRFNGLGGLPVGSDWRLTVRMTAQGSQDALVPGEQFGLTGAQAVRGYSEREVTGDSGWAASLELSSPAWLQSTTRFVAFGDAGSVRNADSAPCNGQATRCTLAAAGVGLRVGRGPLQIRLDVAQALRAGLMTADKDVRAHLQASLAFP